MASRKSETLLGHKKLPSRPASSVGDTRLGCPKLRRQLHDGWRNTAVAAADFEDSTGCKGQRAWFHGWYHCPQFWPNRRQTPRACGVGVGGRTAYGHELLISPPKLNPLLSCHLASVRRRDVVTRKGSVWCLFRSKFSLVLQFDWLLFCL